MFMLFQGSFRAAKNTLRQLRLMQLVPPLFMLDFDVKHCNIILLSVLLACYTDTLQ